jgi:hypothetical protein
MNMGGGVLVYLQMVVEFGDLPDGARVLQLRHCLTLHTEDDAVLAPDAHHGAASLDSLHGVLNLMNCECEGLRMSANNTVAGGEYEGPLE